MLNLNPAAADHESTFNKQKIVSLQVLRALAAILILMCHGTGMVRGKLHYDYLNLFFTFSGANVDVFFVISGFIIYHSIKTRRPDYDVREFLLRRLARIFPIYWVALISTVLLFLLCKYLFPGTIFVSEPIFLLKSFFLIPNSINHRTLGISWTLSLEVIFYILAISLFYSRKAYFLILIMWTLFCITNLFFFHYDYRGLLINFTHAYLHPAVVEFLLGSILAMYVLNNRLYYKKTVLLIGITLFVSCVLLKFNSMYIPNEAAYGIPSILILYGLLEIKKYPKILIYLGNASYSIYLFHCTVILFLLKIIRVLGVENYIKNIYLVSALFVLAMFICCIIYNYIEKPLLAYSYKKIDVLCKKIRNSRSVKELGNVLI